MFYKTENVRISTIWQGADVLPDKILFWLFLITSLTITMEAGHVIPDAWYEY